MRAVAGAVARLGDTLIPESPLWSQFTRIGANLTPQQVSNIIRDADQGRPAMLVDLVHECRQKDGHMQAVLGVRELAVAALDWSIDPPPDATDAEKQQAALCKAALKNCQDFTVLVAHLVGEGCLFPTGAWAELIWQVQRFGPTKGIEAPIAMKRINSRRFGFRQSDGKLLFIGRAGGTAESDGIDLLEEYGPGNFVHRLPRINGDVQVREGLARIFVWMAVLRNWGIRDWLLAGEMGWKPWRIATYKKTVDGKDREFAEAMIQTLTATGAGVKPDTVDLDIQWPKSSGSNLQSVHKELVEFIGMEMSKAGIGQTLTIEAGARGARSLGEVHNAVRKDVRESDATDIAGTLTRDVVGPFYAFNFPSARPGTFRFHTEAGVDITALSNAIDKLADKVAIPQSWVRDEIGAPEPKEGEPICGTGGKTEPEDEPDQAADIGQEDDLEDDLEDEA